MMDGAGPQIGGSYNKRYRFTPQRLGSEDFTFVVDLSAWERTHLENLALPVHRRLNNTEAKSETIDILLEDVVNALWEDERIEAAIFFSGVARTLEAKRVKATCIGFIASCGILEELPPMVPEGS